MNGPDRFSLPDQTVFFTHAVRNIVPDAFRLFDGGLKKFPHTAVADPFDLAIAGLQGPQDPGVTGNSKESGLFHIQASVPGLTEHAAKYKSRAGSQSLPDIGHVKKSQPDLSRAVRPLKMRDHAGAFAENRTGSDHGEPQGAQTPRI